MFLCVARAADDVPVPDSKSRVTDDRNAVYEGWPFVGEEPLTLRYLADDGVSLTGMRGAGLRTVGLLGCAAFWSNLFFKSFTLGFCPGRLPYAVVAAGLDLEVPPSCLSSMGADTERTGGLAPGRVEETVGCLEVAPLPLDSDDRFWSCLGTGKVDAINSSYAGSGTSAWTPR